jgi:hypothetical protein
MKQSVSPPEYDPEVAQMAAEHKRYAGAEYASENGFCADQTA